MVIPVMQSDLFRNGVFLDKDDFENTFLITSGQYTGAFRAFPNAKILWYFSNLGLICTSDVFAGAGYTDRILPYLKKMLDNVVILRDNTIAYTLNNKIFEQDMVWECTTAGTSAGSSTFPASNTVGDTHVDGTATFTARLEWFGSSNYVLYDTSDDLTTLVNPDSHDAYITKSFVLINKYNTISGSFTWLAGASNNRGLSYQSIVDGMYKENIQDQFNADDLVYTFQGQILPTDGSAYSFRFTLDNLENLNGLLALKQIYNDVGDATREGEVDTDLAKIRPALIGLYDPTNLHFLRYSGADGTDVSDATRINRWEVQYAIQRYLNDEDTTAIQRQSSINYANASTTGIPSWWLKREIDAIPTGSKRNLNLGPHIAELETIGDFEILKDAVTWLEKYYLPDPTNLGLVISDAGALIKIKRQMVGL